MLIIEYLIPQNRIRHTSNPALLQVDGRAGNGGFRAHGAVEVLDGAIGYGVQV